MPNCKTFLVTKAETKHVRRRARFQQHRDARCHQVFFSARQGAEGNSRHFDRNIRATCNILGHLQKLGGKERWPRMHTWVGGRHWSVCFKQCYSFRMFIRSIQNGPTSSWINSLARFSALTKCPATSSCWQYIWRHELRGISCKIADSSLSEKPGVNVTCKPYASAMQTAEYYWQVQNSKSRRFVTAANRMHVDTTSVPRYKLRSVVLTLCFPWQ